MWLPAFLLRPYNEVSFPLWDFKVWMNISFIWIPYIYSLNFMVDWTLCSSHSLKCWRTWQKALSVFTCCPSCISSLLFCPVYKQLSWCSVSEPHFTFKYAHCHCVISYIISILTYIFCMEKISGDLTILLWLKLLWFSGCTHLSWKRAFLPMLKAIRLFSFIGKPYCPAHWIVSVYVVA